MSGICYGGETLNGKFIASMISQNNDYVYFNQLNKNVFARIEVVFNSEKDWEENKDSELALVSYKSAEKYPADDGFDDYQPIISFSLTPLNISDIPDDPWNFLGNVEKLYGEDNFKDALKILFQQTALAFKQGIKCTDKGVVEYIREA